MERHSKKIPQNLHLLYEKEMWPCNGHIGIKSSLRGGHGNKFSKFSDEQGPVDGMVVTNKSVRCAIQRQLPKNI